MAYAENRARGEVGGAGVAPIEASPPRDTLFEK